jgi:hypothetical protein
MRETVVALFDDFGTAQRVVEDLVDAGYLRDNISLVANDAAGEYAQYVERVGEDVTAGEGAGFGAVVGTLAGLGVALIPGIGPVWRRGRWRRRYSRVLAQSSARRLVGWWPD